MRWDLFLLQVQGRSRLNWFGRSRQSCPAEVEKYGVFVDAGFDEIVSTVAACWFDRGAAPSLLRRLAALSVCASILPGQRFGILRVLHYKEQEFEQQLSELSRNDLWTEYWWTLRRQRAVGGTGTSFNWLGARSSFLQAAPHLRLIAAGGLAPENVKQAIQILRPWGVDVVSGVESAPGKKDPARVLAFIRSAQQADGRIEGRYRSLKLSGGTLRARQGFSWHIAEKLMFVRHDFSRALSLTIRGL